MTKLYEKNSLAFALAWIGAYVVLASLADNLSQSIGTIKLITVPVLAVLAAVLYIWIARNGLKAELGLCRLQGKAGDYLWFAPLLLLLTVNLWHGVRMNYGHLETVLYIASMLLVGFLEELIFRGLLFRAMCPGGIRSAFVVSSLTFGMGHMVNLLNGAEFLPTLLQVCYAVAIGFLFTLIFYKGKSLWPCILTHSIFNSLSAFSVEPGTTGRILTAIALCVIPLGYALWLWKGTGQGGAAEKKHPEGEWEHENQ